MNSNNEREYYKYPNEVYEFEDDKIMLLIAWHTKHPSEDNVEHLEIIEHPGTFEIQPDELVLNFSAN